jgi:hypothetical protein
VARQWRDFADVLPEAAASAVRLTSVSKDAVAGHIPFEAPGLAPDLLPGLEPGVTVTA